MLLHRCLHCFAANACEVRFDKKGRPYTVCKVCWAKAFFQSLDSLRGAAIVPQLVEAAMVLRETDPDYARRFDEKIVTMVRWVHDNSRPAAGVKPTPLNDASLSVPFELEAKLG